jgi:hypothetical protein
MGVALHVQLHSFICMAQCMNLLQLLVWCRVATMLVVANIITTQHHKDMG